MALGRLGAAVAALFLGLGCATTPRIEVDHHGSSAPWTHLEARDAERDFHFVLVTDRTGGERDGVFDVAVEKVNLLQPAFVMSVGDLIEGYTEDPAELDAQWAEFDAFAESFDAPFFYVAGNHDYSNTSMAEDWKHRFGPSYYHFRYKDVLFLVLNTEIVSSVRKPGTPIEGPDDAESQLRYAERVLGEHGDARWTFVIVHQPYWDQPDTPEMWERFEALLGERPYTVFAGHYHRYTKHVRHGRPYITLATTGGVSQMRGIDRGEFDHVAMVSVTDDGPVMANLMLDGIHDEDVRTEARRNLVDQLDRAVRAEPLLVEPGVFGGGTQGFQLHNPSDRPFTFRGRFESGPDFTPEPAELEHVVAPGETDTVGVKLVSRARPRTEELTPALAHWTVETPEEPRRPDGTGGAPVRVERRALLLPDARFEVPSGPPVEVDAFLGDWDPLRFSLRDWPEVPSGRADASLRFDVRHDDDYLYVAIDVRDSTPWFSTELSPFDQDGVALEIDARPDPERSANLGLRAAIQDGTLKQLLMEWLSPVDAEPARAAAKFLPDSPDGLRRAVERTATGYAVELAIPAAYLDERAGGPWQHLRINLTLQDFAGEGEEGRYHNWRPSRFGMGGVLGVEGAGSFVRRSSGR